MGVKFLADRTGHVSLVSAIDLLSPFELRISPGAQTCAAYYLISWNRNAFNQHELAFRGEFQYHDQAAELHIVLLLSSDAML